MARREDQSGGMAEAWRLHYGPPDRMNGGVRIAVTLAVFAVMLVLVAMRPRRWPEAIWTVAGGGAMLAIGLVTPREALDAAMAGKNALLFLLSLLALSVLIGKSGFFDWAAIHCARAAGGRTRILYRNMFLLGAAITAVMSLDTTAVMLTPVVLSCARKLERPTAPFVVLCALIANVGSLLLPISNLTNLLFADTFDLSFASFAARMAVPQILALVTTYWLLRWRFQGELGAWFSISRLPTIEGVIHHRGYFRACVIVLALVLAGYFIAPLFDLEPYVISFAGVLVLVIAGAATKQIRPRAAIELSWGVFPLVIGLFVAVQGLENLGIVGPAAHWLAGQSSHPTLQLGAVAGSTAVASNFMNNLPAALLARSTLSAAHASPHLALAALAGADIGSMITPLGSLATILVLTLARRDNAELPIRVLLKITLWMTPLILLATILPLLFL